MIASYIVQGGALEDYLRESQSNGNGNGIGSGNQDECQTPFTPCWCETRPNNKHCRDQPPAATIDDYSPIVLIIVGVFILIKSIRSKIKSKIK